MAPAIRNDPTDAALRSLLRLLLFLLALFLTGNVSRGKEERGEAPQALPVLRTIREIRELPSEKAKLGYPIHLRAVVTYADRAQGDFFVQDSTAGIFVNIGQAPIELHSGQSVQIDGISGPGDFASEIDIPRFKSWARSLCPFPRRSQAWISLPGLMTASSWKLRES